MSGRRAQFSAAEDRALELTDGEVTGLENWKESGQVVGARPVVPPGHSAAESCDTGQHEGHGSADVSGEWWEERATLGQVASRPAVLVRHRLPNEEPGHWQCDWSWSSKTGGPTWRAWGGAVKVRQPKV